MLAAASQKYNPRIALLKSRRCLAFSTDVPAAVRINRHNGRMDAYSQLDHSTLVRNMNAVCAGLGRAVNQSGFLCGVPPALTFDDLDDLIPLTLYRIAVAAGWIEEQIEPDEDDGGEDGDVFAGHLWLTASFKEWFLGLVAGSLTALGEDAENNRAAQEDNARKLIEYQLAWSQAKGVQPPQDTEPDNPAKRIIDKFYETSPTIHNHQALADAVSQAKPDGDKYPITRVTISRIYNGFGAGLGTRLEVAKVVNKIVPCTHDDLKRTKPKPKTLE
jgi:hypothetical protein